MTPRHKRVKKILELRERRLDERASHLTQARVLASQAELALTEQQRRTEAAVREREEMASRAVSARDWVDSEAWRMRCGNQELVLGERASRAQLVVQKAHDQVRSARSEVKQIETLRENLLQADLAVMERRARVNEDEIAADRVRRNKDGK